MENNSIEKLSTSETIDSPELANAKLKSAEAQRLKNETESLVETAKFNEALKSLQGLVGEEFNKCGAIKSLQILKEMSSGSEIPLQGADFINEFKARAKEHSLPSENIDHAPTTYDEIEASESDVRGATLEEISSSPDDVLDSADLATFGATDNTSETVSEMVELSDAASPATEFDSDVAQALRWDVATTFMNMHSVDLNQSLGGIVESLDKTIDAQAKILGEQLQYLSRSMEQGAEALESSEGESSPDTQLLEMGIESTRQQIAESVDEQEIAALEEKLQMMEEDLARQRGQGTKEYQESTQGSLEDAQANLSALNSVLGGYSAQAA